MEFSLNGNDRTKRNLTAFADAVNDRIAINPSILIDYLKFYNVNGIIRLIYIIRVRFDDARSSRDTRDNEASPPLYLSLSLFLRSYKIVSIFYRDAGDSPHEL